MGERRKIDMWLNPFSRKRKQDISVAAQITPSTEIVERDIRSEWQQFLKLRPTKDDLLVILDEYPFEPRIRELAGETLLAQHRDTLTIDGLNTIIRYTIGMRVSLEASQLVLDRATTKDDLGQIVISAPSPSLRLEAARRTLAMNPETHDLMRCLEIPELAEEAFGRLLASNPPKSTLLHILRFNRRLAPDVQKHIDEHGLRVDLTPRMHALLGSMQQSEHTRH